MKLKTLTQVNIHILREDITDALGYIALLGWVYAVVRGNLLLAWNREYFA